LAIGYWPFDSKPHKTHKGIEEEKFRDGVGFGFRFDYWLLAIGYWPFDSKPHKTHKGIEEEKFRGGVSFGFRCDYWLLATGHLILNHIRHIGALKKKNLGIMLVIVGTEIYKTFSTILLLILQPFNPHKSVPLIFFDLHE
jgi:hypothetical protein